MHNAERTVFERHKKKTIVIVALCLLLFLVIVCEFVLQKKLGLGKPVLYDSSPIYGYRPLPNREYVRFKGSKVTFNNMGLRTEDDWDENAKNKVLFIGDSVTFGGTGVDNEELFSYLAVRQLNASGASEYMSGNAGVNAWGVENIHGLIVESRFLPAEIYVTILPERDFYRGKTRFHGLPYFNKEPGLALLELWYYFCYQQNNKRYKKWTLYATEREKAFVLDKEVRKLKEMDTFIKERGYKHFIFISPTKEQVVKGAGKDMIIYDLLHQNGLSPLYIVDKIAQYPLTDKEKEDLFKDAVHLKKSGHVLWAEIIASELKQNL